MELSNANPVCHSADVQMHLRINGHILPIAQLGPDFLVLKTPIDHAPDVAEIDVSIDGSRRRWFVNLPDGLAVQLRKTRIASLEPDNGDNERSPSPIAP